MWHTTHYTLCIKYWGLAISTEISKGRTETPWNWTVALGYPLDRDGGNLDSNR